MANIGKIKKNQEQQMQYKLNKIISEIENTPINSKEAVSYINGLEHALSIMENRESVHISFIKKSWIEQIKGLFNKGSN